MFKVRLISGIIMVAVLALVLILGGPVLWAAVLAVSLAGMYEFYRLGGLEKTILGLAGYLGAIVYAVLLLCGFSEITMAFVLGMLIIIMAVYVFAFPEYTSDEALQVFFGMIYIPVMLFNLYRIRLLDSGFLVWLVIIGSWGCDTCAYCVGIRFGRHKMTPRLSPKKSVEGAVAGVVGSAILGLLFGLIFSSHLNYFKIPALTCALICAAAALVSMIGDLAASAFKRNYEVKDFGSLIPGHGGILDRFDSVIFVAPVIYYLIILLAA